MSRTFAVTVLGHDRPGIIAEVTGALADLGGNLEDSSMTLLRGHFAWTLLVASDSPAEDVAARLAHLVAEGLVVSVLPVPDPAGAQVEGSAYLLSVHGADRPGIVSGLSRWIVGLRRAMELMLTGDHMSGAEAAECGFANRAFPEAELEEQVLRIAERVARTPIDLQQINKRAVHRQMDAMGIRAALRAGTEMQTLATFTRTAQEHFAEIRKGLTAALSKRDAEYGDYRTGDKKSS